jgi:hypothetical protein
MNRVDNELVQEQVVTFVQDHILHAKLNQNLENQIFFILSRLLHQVLMIDKYQQEHQDLLLLLTYVQH